MAFLSGYTPRWSPDGKSLVVVGWDRDEMRAGFYRVELQTGELTALVITGDNSVPPLSQFNPDGAQFLYRDPARGIVARSLMDETETIVLPIDGRGIDRFFIAPDAHAIALIRSVQIDRDRWTTTLEVRQQDGTVRELASATTPRRLDLHGWTNDAREVIYSEGRLNDPFKLYRVSELGGQPIDLRFSAAPTPNPVSVSPDGRRVAYTERVVEYEVWIEPFGQ